MILGKINKQSIAISSFTSVLTTIHSPPKQLYCAGVLPKTRVPTVAIVGSRKPTPYGIEVTQKLAADLARNGVVIVSGLATGIDSIAHKAALEVGGVTIAIVANGLHKIYPASNLGLAREIIAKGGAIISEYEEGFEPRGYHFLARNRLVSGIADAVIVTEAAERSGSLSTVAHAYEQNKEVFAVPGPITSLMSAGPNRVLQQGAHVVLEARDVIEVIAPSFTPSQAALPLGYTPIETRLIELIKAGVRDGELLKNRCDTSASEFLQALTMLELNGTIRSLGANQWALR